MTDDDPVNGYGPWICWARWVRAGVFLTLSPSARDVAQALASFASRDAGAFPSARTIARLTGHTRTTVFEALKELKAQGVVEAVGRVQRRDNNANGPVIYRFLAPPTAWSLCGRDRPSRTAANPAERFKKIKGLSAKDQAGLSPRDGDGLSGSEIGGPSGRGTEGPVLEVLREERDEGGVGAKELSSGACPRHGGRFATDWSSYPPPWKRDPKSGEGVTDVRRAKRLAALRLLRDNPNMTDVARANLAKKAGYPRDEVTEMFGEPAVNDKNVISASCDVLVVRSCEPGATEDDLSPQREVETALA